MIYWLYHLFSTDLCSEDVHGVLSQTRRWKAQPVYSDPQAFPASSLILAFSVNRLKKKAYKRLELILLVCQRPRAVYKYFIIQTSIFCLSHMRACSTLAWNFPQKLKPSFSRPGVLSSHCLNRNTVTEWVSEWVIERVSEWVNKWVNEWVSESDCVSK